MEIRPFILNRKTNVIRTWYCWQLMWDPRSGARQPVYVCRINCVLFQIKWTWFHKNTTTNRNKMAKKYRLLISLPTFGGLGINCMLIWTKENICFAPNSRIEYSIRAHDVYDAIAHTCSADTLVISLKRLKHIYYIRVPNSINMRKLWIA